MELFSTNEVHERQIKLRGETGSVYVRKLPAIDLRRYVEEVRSEDMDMRLAAGFRLIAKAIRNEDGTARMTLEEAKTLKPAAVKELMRVIEDVNAESDAGND